MLALRSVCDAHTVILPLTLWTTLYPVFVAVEYPGLSGIDIRYVSLAVSTLKLTPVEQADPVGQIAYVFTVLVQTVAEGIVVGITPLLSTAY